jgi:anti-sigma factor RsiW
VHSGPAYDPGVPANTNPHREALSALPSPLARALAFIAILIGGLAGGLIGYGFVDLQSDDTAWAAVGGLVGAVASAAGTAVIAVLVLRAMGEWRQIHQEHPGR